MFQEVIVIDYITDINALTSDQISTLVKNLVNSHFLENCPNGTIIAIPISGLVTNQKRVYYPFFSHISMPVKAGERAWVFDQTAGRVSYWLTSKVQNTTARDLNFSHDDRARFYGSIKSDPNARNLNSSIFYDSQSSGILLESIVKAAVSKDEFAGEPVLGLKSKSIDLTIQGSNNTAIKMASDGGKGAGTIDIVAGPAMVSDQSKITNARGYEEIVKPVFATDSGYQTAGNLSQNDESRIVVSRNFNADSYYSITGDDSGSQPTVSIKSDAVRIVSQNDLKISVNSGASQSSIIIKSDGNIVITPGGNIKLAGDLSDQPYLRYDDFRKIISGIEGILGSLQTAITSVTSATPGATAIAAVSPGIGTDLAQIEAAMETIKSQKILGS